MIPALAPSPATRWRIWPWATGWRPRRLESLGNDLAYPYAWSLVHLLLQEPSRQRGVSDLLNALAQHRCLGFDHVDALDRGYAGGLTALERDWQRWLLGNQAAAMQF